MPIPDYQSAMLPLLRMLEGGGEIRFRDAVEHLSKEFDLTDGQRAEMLPSGTAPLFDNRVGWARTYLKQAGLVESPKRGILRITDRGRSLLDQRPSRINVALLDQYPEFQAFKVRRREKGDAILTIEDSRAAVATSTSESTPEDQLAAAYTAIRSSLEVELLEQVQSCSPAFFERLVVDLLVRMGYGGSRQDAGRVIGKSGDEGIDGTIKEDKLGLDTIYLQAKRWQGVVGRPEIQKFAGALQGQRASKGVFITTSSFTREAEEYVNLISTKIILIDGETLAQLMVDHNVGVSRHAQYEIKRIDSDYFEGE